MIFVGDKALGEGWTIFCFLSFSSGRFEFSKDEAHVFLRVPVWLTPAGF
jgi:hypothetical protein